MFTVSIAEKGGATRQLEFDKGEVNIGRIKENDIILAKSNVSKRHARLVVKEDKFIILDLKSTNGTYVNGRKITSPQVVRTPDKIYIGDFVLNLVSGEEPALAAQTGHPPPSRPQGPPQEAHRGGSPLPSTSTSSPMYPSSPPAPSSPAPAAPSPATPAAKSIAKGVPLQGRPGGNPPVEEAGLPKPTPGYSQPPPSQPQPKAAMQPPESPAPLKPLPSALAGDPFSETRSTSRPDLSSPATPQKERLGAGGGVRMEPRQTGHPQQEPNRDLLAALKLVHARVLERLPMDEVEGLSWDAYRERAEHAIIETVAALHGTGGISAGIQKEEVTQAALAEALGYGPLESLLADPEVTEIQIGGPQSIWIKHGKGLQCAPLAFSGEGILLGIMGRLAAETGNSLNSENPVVCGKRRDGTRVVATLRSISPSGPTLLLRKAPTIAPTLKSLVQRQVITEELANILESAVHEYRNVIIGGPPGSGRGTLLNALACATSPHERIACVEFMGELKLHQQTAIHLEEHPVRSGGGARSLNQGGLISTALAMAPHRLLVTDLSIAGALPLLQAMAAGTRGVMVTTGGMNPWGALAELHTLCMAGSQNLNPDAIRLLIGGAVDLVVTLALVGGKPKVSQVAQVSGTSEEPIILKDLVGPRRGADDHWPA